MPERRGDFRFIALRAGLAGAQAVASAFAGGGDGALGVSVLQRLDEIGLIGMTAIGAFPKRIALVLAGCCDYRADFFLVRAVGLLAGNEKKWQGEQGDWNKITVIFGNFSHFFFASPYDLGKRWNTNVWIIIIIITK